MNNPFSPYPDMVFKPEGYKTEDQLQAAQIKWFDEEFPAERKMIFSVPNGGLRDPRTANVLMATGVKRGPSDLIFIVDKVIFLENKLPGETQLPDQIIFMDKVVERGHEYYVIEYLEMFKKFVTNRINRMYARRTAD